MAKVGASSTSRSSGGGKKKSFESWTGEGERERAGDSSGVVFFSRSLNTLSPRPSENRRKNKLIDALFSVSPPFPLQHTMLRAPQMTMRAGSAALASCSSSARPALLPPRSGAQRRRFLSPLVARAGNATEEAPQAADASTDECADNIGDFCSLDKSVGGMWKGGGKREMRKRARQRQRGNDDGFAHALALLLFFLLLSLTLSRSKIFQHQPNQTYRARSSPPSARWETWSRTLSRR